VEVRHDEVFNWRDGFGFRLDGGTRVRVTHALLVG